MKTILLTLLLGLAYTGLFAQINTFTQQETYIDTYVNANGSQRITGAILNTALVDYILKNQPNAIYDTTRSYLVGQFCVKDTIPYICIVNTAGSFDSNDWKAITSNTIWSNGGTFNVIDNNSNTSAINWDGDGTFALYPSSGSAAETSFYITPNGQLTVRAINEDVDVLSTEGNGDFIIKDRSSGDTTIYITTNGVKFSTIQQGYASKQLYYNTISDDVTYEDAIISTVITVDSAAVKTLNTSPVTLISAQGSNKLIHVISAQVYLDAGSTQFNPAGILEIYYNTSEAEIFESNMAGYGGTTDKMGMFIPVISTASNGNNKPIILKATNNCTLGNGRLKIIITYSVKDI